MAESAALEPDTRVSLVWRVVFVVLALGLGALAILAVGGQLLG